MSGTALTIHRDGEMAAQSGTCRSISPDSGAGGEIHGQDSRDRWVQS